VALPWLLSDSKQILPPFQDVFLQGKNQKDHQAHTANNDLISGKISHSEKRKEMNKEDNIQ